LGPEMFPLQILEYDPSPNMILWGYLIYFIFIYL
jgi:hypothetical protein